MAIQRRTLSVFPTAAQRAAMPRDEPAWFRSEVGIRGYFAEQREAEAKRHLEASKRINDEEDAFIEAFRNSQITNSGKGKIE